VKTERELHFRVLRMAKLSLAGVLVVFLCLTGAHHAAGEHDIGLTLTPEQTSLFEQSWRQLIEATQGRIVLSGVVVDEQGAALQGVVLQIEKAKLNNTRTDVLVETETRTVNGLFNVDLSGYFSISLKFEKDGYSSQTVSLSIPFPEHLFLNALQGEEIGTLTARQENLRIVLKSAANVTELNEYNEVLEFATTGEAVVIDFDRPHHPRSSVIGLDNVFDPAQLPSNSVYVVAELSGGQIATVAKPRPDSDIVDIVPSRLTLRMSDPAAGFIRFTPPDPNQDAFGQMGSAPESGYANTLVVQADDFIDGGFGGGVTFFFKTGAGKFGKGKTRWVNVNADRSVVELAITFSVQPDGSRNTQTSPTLEETTTTIVADIVPPDLSGCTDNIVPCAGPSGKAVSYSVTATDDTDPNPTVVCNPPSGTVFPIGQSTVACAATDAAGNSSQCSFTVTVQDTIPPVPNAASLPDVTGQCSATIGSAPTATDNCAGTIAGTTSDPLTRSTQGTSIVTWTFDDGHGNIATQTQRIIVADTRPPEITGCAADTTVSCASAIPAADVAAVSATDNCGGPVTVSHVDDVTTAGSCPNKFTVTRTYKVSDGNGNSASCSQTITVDDSTPPVLSGCPADASFQCISQLPAPANVTASDGCDGAVAVSFSETQSNPGSSCNNTITRKWTATDACGNSASCSQTITVADTIAPVMACPGNQTIVPACGKSAVFAEATATDNCGSASVSCSPASGSNLGEGVHTVTCTATDACGNTSSCSFEVTVLAPLRVAFQPPLADDNVADDIETDQDIQNRFKVGSKVPHKVLLFDCAGNDVTASRAGSVTVKLDVTLRQYVNATTSTAVVDLPENYSGAGSPGGIMMWDGTQFHYNLDTTGYPAGTASKPEFFRSHVTVIYNSAPAIIVGEEDALLESR
jgi:hypothetical protein